jgi:HEAT repeat protein
MMSLAEIEANLTSLDPQVRMRGITELRHYDAVVAVPLLASRQTDQELIVRSFVAMGLGYKQNDEAFATLVKMLGTESDANVRSEVANALIKYGRTAIPHIVPAFYTYPDWLMRMSILLALTDMDAPQELFQLCLAAFVDPNPTVQETGVKCLAFLAESEMAEDALLHLLAFAQSSTWQVRQQAAISLRWFTDPRATEALTQLQRDSDYRVVSAVLEGTWASASAAIEENLR